MSGRVNLSSHGSELKSAYQAVLDSNNPNTYCIFGYDKGTNDLKVVEEGDGDLEDFVECFEDGLLLYGFVRIKDPNTNLPKFIFVSWCGEGVPMFKKGSFPSHLGDVMAFMKAYHIHIDARDESDINPQQIMKRVNESSGAKYSYHEQAKQSASQPPTSSKPRTPPVLPSKSKISIRSTAVNNLVNTNPSVSNSSIKPQPLARVDTPIPPLVPSPVDDRIAPARSGYQKVSLPRPKPLQNRFLEQAAQAERERQEEATRERERRDKGYQDQIQAQLKQDKLKQKEEFLKLKQQEELSQQQQYQEDDLEAERESALEQDRQRQLEEEQQRQAEYEIQQREAAEQERLHQEHEEYERQQKEAEEAAEQERLHQEHEEYERQQKEAEEAAEQGKLHQEQVEYERQQRETEEAAERERLQQEQDEYERQQKEAEEQERLHQEEQAQRAAAEEEEQALLAQQAAAASELEYQEHPEAASATQGDSEYFTAIALYDYQPGDDNELNLREGEMVTKIQQLEEGWWHGLNESNESGIFPSNYVEVVDNLPADMESSDQPQTNGHIIEEQPQEESPIAIALYDYVASDEAEISFGMDQYIYDIEFISDDWWQGSLETGEKGIFPANYVKLVDQ